MRGLEILRRELTLAARALLRTRTQSLAAVLTLGLAIGAVLTLAAVVHAVLLRPLDYRDPSRLALVWGQIRGLDYSELWLSGPEFLDLERESRSFSEIAILRPRDLSLTAGPEPQPVKAIAASGRFFALLGVQPLAGRTFGVEDDRAGAPKVAVLSHGMARRLFGDAEAAVGKSLALNGEDHQVLGVMPASFRVLPPDGLLPRQVDLYVPIARDLSRMSRDWWLFNTLARLAPGVSLEAAQQEVAALAARLSADHPDAYQGHRFEMVLDSYHGFLTRSVRPTLGALAALVGLVLAIACANVGGLQLSAAVGRGQERALCAALGATRWPLVRRALAESLLLATLGTALGLVLAAAANRLLAAWGPADLPRLDEVKVGLAMLLAAGAVILLTGLFAGLPPALQAARPALGAVLQSNDRAGVTAAARRGLSALIVFEIALALAPLTAAGLLGLSFLRLSRVETGFAVEDRITAKLQPPPGRHADDGERITLFERAAEELATLPGVEAVGAISHLPLSGAFAAATFEAATDRAAEESTVQADLFAVLPGTLEVLDVRLVEGRTFSRLDTAATAAVTIVDETLAARLWPGRSALGQKLRFVGLDDPGAAQAGIGAWFRVVGVVRSLRHQGPGSPPRQQVFFPLRQVPWNLVYLVAKHRGPAAGLEAGVRRAVARVDPAQAVAELRPFASYLDEARARPRFQLALVGALAALALVLAAVGVYGVIGYLHSQRRREVGIRLALGAGRTALLGTLLRPGMLLGLTGITLGLAGAALTTRVLAALLFGVGTFDALIFALMPALLAAVVFIAIYLPARRLLREDAVRVLREG